MDWEEQRAELIEGLLSSSSPSQLAMQEAVSVLLYMAQDDTSSSGGDSPQVIPFHYLIAIAILLCLLLHNCMTFVAATEASRGLPGQPGIILGFSVLRLSGVVFSFLFSKWLVFVSVNKQD